MELGMSSFPDSGAYDTVDSATLSELSLSTSATPVFDQTSYLYSTTCINIPDFSTLNVSTNQLQPTTTIPTLSTAATYTESLLLPIPVTTNTNCFPSTSIPACTQSITIITTTSLPAKSIPPPDQHAASTPAHPSVSPASSSLNSFKKRKITYQDV